MASSSSSSTTTPWLFDVFLSFKGETRKSFTDHLYVDLCQAGINTFRDDEEIPKGENISARLLEAIEGSKISIIVFSKTYARSRWCLDELVKILECKEKLQQMVLPIFYNVDPSEVRKQTGEFGEALNQHRKRFGDLKVDEWKTALTTVADLSGWDLQIMTNGFESKFIKKITEEVLREVNHTYMNVAKYPVGIDSRVRDIHHLLQSQTNNDVKMIGIFGMGGVGKTTLAKALYNLSFQRFEGSCFIANIRSEVSERRHNGLVRLQEKLLCETLKRKKFEIDNVDRGISLIKERLRSKKIIIVLDDIDHITQLESLAGQRDWFGSGSIIIMTTRDIHLLSNLGTHEKYKVDMLSTNESLELFSWHAFDDPIPLEGYVELSKKVAGYTNGLPLALKVIGSHLHGKSVQEWRDDIEKLKKIPHGEVQEILKISYDALDDDTQNIFLDIASFFNGHDKNDTAMILEACGFYAESGIRTLAEKCLLTIDQIGKVGRLEMHDLVQDMGREIVRKESPREPGKRSRLMDPKDVFDVLQDNKGTEAIEGMIVNSNMLKYVPLNTKLFTRMVKLRILILDGVCLNGSFEYLSNELRLFRLYNCHLSHIPSNSCFGKLVELDVQDSNIEEFQPNMQYFRCLKILKLDGCEQLKKTLDFTGAQSLQKIFFINCSNLVKVHPSIGSLESLVELHFSSCKKLKVLPSSICKLRSLEFLILNGCEKLEELPIDLGKLEQLRGLYAQRTAISHLPFSLGCLRNLEVLRLGEQKGLLPLESKSQLLGILSPHLWSKRTRNPLGFFPPSVANLCSLESLSMPNNYLHEVDLPIALGSLTSLAHLDLSGSCYLQNLPFTLCHLSNLKSLRLDNLQNLRALPELPPNLEELSAENCVSLEKVAYISNLRRLKGLYIPNCKSLVELPGLACLESLEVLDLASCNALITSYNYLQEVDLSITVGDGDGDFSLSTYLDLNGNCSLQTLPFNLCHLSNLKSLNLEDLQNLRALLQLPPSLEELSIKNCVRLERVADISNLKSLEELNIRNCKSLVELPGLKNLESLRNLEITNCSALSISSTEKWFKARYEGDSVKIWLQVWGTLVFCNIPTCLGFESLKLIISENEQNRYNGVRVRVRSKTTGAWIVKEPKYIQINGYDKIEFEVPTVIAQVLEVYAEFCPLQTVCLFEIYRNREEEVRFFPSTRGLLEFEETATDGSLSSLQNEENRLMIETVADSTGDEQNGRGRRRHTRCCIWEFLLKCFCWDNEDEHY
ncbi:disease resistance protein TAO1-like [Ipomoea triloba]|uniref:disease resistance protein TAO1-like n=1 Tax=Ipomoea triloba TaxID=35885 RepID=UPI00125D9E99|nr:disease resistance protein TAO1-like [Ipomoea triloba]